MKNIGRIITNATLALIFVSCATPIALRFSNTDKENVNIRQAKKTELAKGDTARKSMPKQITFKDANGVEQTVMNTTMDEKTGENLMTVDIPEVTVISKNKTIPERNGMVCIDFIVTVPSALFQDDWRIAVHPLIEKQTGTGIKDTLYPVYITGREFRFLEERREFAFANEEKRVLRNKSIIESRRSIFKNPDSLGYTPKYTLMHKMWKKDKNLRDSLSVRLDTVVRSGKNLEYHYSQLFPSAELDRKLTMTFNAEIISMAKGSHTLPHGDTINYFLSSMVQFVDTIPKYLGGKIKRLENKTSQMNVSFANNSSVLDIKSGFNQSEINRVVNEGKEYTKEPMSVDSVLVKYPMSPDGTKVQAYKLAGARAKAIVKTLSSLSGIQSQIFKTQIMDENWNKLSKLIQKESDRIPDWSEILDIIESVSDNDKKERLIAGKHPKSYSFIKQVLYRELGDATVIFHTRRTDMTSDEAYGKDIDRNYMNAVNLMKQRQYSKALEILINYEDYNTAVCYLCLGYNQKAYDIMIKQPSTADNEYILAILESRLGREAQAVSRYKKSCEMDSTKVWRGNLDPEISRLIETYGLNKEDEDLGM